MCLLKQSAEVGVAFVYESALTTTMEAHFVNLSFAHMTFKPPSAGFRLEF